MPNTGPWMPWPWTVQYPSTWYHPVYAAVVVNNAAELGALDSSWSPTAGMADIRRTETEAALVINQAENVWANAIMDAAVAGPPATPETVPPRPGSEAINQNSASWQQMLDGTAPGAPMVEPQSVRDQHEDHASSAYTARFARVGAPPGEPAKQEQGSRPQLAKKPESYAVQGQGEGEAHGRGGQRQSPASREQRAPGTSREERASGTTREEPVENHKPR